MSNTGKRKGDQDGSFSTLDSYGGKKRERGENAFITMMRSGLFDN
jgi:hypothetical protein